MFPYSPFEALKARDFGSSRCPITATMKTFEKIHSHQVYIFSISLTLVVIVGLQRQGLLSLLFAS